MEKKSGNIISTNRRIGEHVCEEFGKKIATLLRLENPNSYTGQCWRGTACTLMADEGMTAKQIQGVSGLFNIIIKIIIKCI